MVGCSPFRLGGKVSSPKHPEDDFRWEKGQCIKTHFIFTGGEDQAGNKTWMGFDEIVADSECERSAIPNPSVGKAVVPEAGELAKKFAEGARSGSRDASTGLLGALLQLFGIPVPVR